VFYHPDGVIREAKPGRIYHFRRTGGEPNGFIAFRAKEQIFDREIAI
jgi:hypothetical protein